MDRVKDALKSALWVSAGITLGKAIAPIRMSTKFYKETYTSLLEQSIFNFLVVYSACFFTFMIINLIRNREE